MTGNLLIKELMKFAAEFKDEEEDPTILEKIKLAVKSKDMKAGEPEKL
jgi:hypothetical protein